MRLVISGVLVATYLQWDRTRPLRQVAWVCGPEEMLRAEVTRHHQASMPEASKTAWAAQVEGLWDYLLASSLGVRLILVPGANSLPLAAERVPVLLDSLDELTRVVFISAADDFEREDGQLAPHLAAIKDSKKGQLIRCCRPSRDEDLLKLIASWWPGAGLNHASRLRAACGDDLTVIWHACDKARRAGLPPAEQSLQYVAPRMLPEDWADAMLAGDRRRAMEAATGMPASLRLRALGSLNHALGQVASYAQWTSRGLEPDEIARRGIDRYRQRQLAPHAARYGPAQEISCRRVLARAEEALRSGASEGVLEVAAALW